ncbi:Adenylate cyclase 1 [Polymorphum gilvum SL003B-26A1]|uniref:Adenylate cyclase 1 n=2 Tax=Polymorphum TaxID=991903 RepID=F2J6E0_POLGS|nr:Adenylate cyclase 1 [Polymorphum gilvum SL003B-26A1]
MALTRIVSLSFGALVAVAVSLVLYMTVKANYENTFSLLGDKAILITQSMERQVRSHLDQVEMAAVGVKALIEEKRIAVADVDRLLDDLSSAIAANTHITVLLVTDPKGDRNGVFRAPNGRLWPFKRQVPIDGQQIHHLPDLEPTSRPTWGPLVQNPMGFFANVSVPLVVDGTLVGYLTASSSIASIGEAIEKLDDGPDSTTFILTGDDLLIVHSDKHLLTTGGQPTAALPAPISAFGDPVLANLANKKVFSGFRHAADLGIEIAAIEAEGDEFLMMRVPITGYSTQPWMVGQYFRAATVSREIRRLAGSAVVGIGAMVIAVLIAIWLGRRVAQPLRVIAEQSEHVGRLALDDVQPLPRSRVKEIDQVALAFNAMVIGLQAMNTYVPRSLFNKLMRLGVDSAARPREAELTMLFTDIVGFTALSENLSAAETAQVLNDHFAILVDAIEAEGGTVDKFIGDGMLAFWGAPDSRPDHAEAAVRTAQKIGLALRANNVRQASEGGVPMRLRIDIHTGSVVVGNVGALDRWNYTIVGDAVNVCERLQSLGREVAAQDEVAILASSETVHRLPSGCRRELVGVHHLRGRSGDIEVWKLDPFEPWTVPVREAGGWPQVPAAQ